MRGFGRFLGRVLLLLIVAGAAVWVFAPREPVDRDLAFDPAVIGEDPAAFLAAREAQFDDIVPGTEKRIVWAGEPGARTALSIVYLHGFSATSEEIRPVPDRVAEALGANLYFTRLAGHGRGSTAMAEPVAGDWIEDMAEALEIGRRIGERVLVISTSTGGTLAAIAAADPDLAPVLMRDVAGMVFVSPNFGIDRLASFLLGLPYVRHWGPILAGAERSFEPESALHGQFWTTRYPSVAAVPLEALVRHANRLDYSTAEVPALFLYAPQDQVVDPGATARVAAVWGGGAWVWHPVLTPADDNHAHVIAGEALSPSQTAPVVSQILDWARAMQLAQ
ncbi:MAG: alpha/beta hydrolase [Pseudorhodobacter sp.]